jgi:hypothetical protein
VRVDVELTNPACVPVQVERLTLEAVCEAEAGPPRASRPWRPAPGARRARRAARDRVRVGNTHRVPQSR